ncbi:lysylphosphatidylglycerol synthase transmembrane domain-containing protein [Lapillicoccus sp.]|uniref:lysylphosphatidylglycerol synthase transmembrane domain-containing protein n=1 Tax=Lapillicoccus sp. TaxID=1909287 RepID=UPI0032651130
MSTDRETAPPEVTSAQPHQAPASDEPAAGAHDDAAAQVEVVEPPIKDRVRRPADAFRLLVVVVLLVGGLFLAGLAVDTRGAVEQDIVQATSGLPRLIVTLLSWLAGIGVVVLPFAVGADLIVRRRPLQLVQALGAALVGGVVVIVVTALELGGNVGFLENTLTRPTTDGRTFPLDIVVVSTLALLTVADIVGRKWISPLAITVIVASVVTTLLSGSLTLAAIVSSLLVGWLLGLAFRLGFGATSTRPPGTDVARALVATGIPLTRLEFVDANDAGDRRYAGTTDTLPVDVHVIDRDTFGLASGRRLLRLLRLRNGFTRTPSLTLRSELEHRTLMGLVLAQARIPAPRPVAVCEVGPFAAVIAYVEPEGTTVADLGDSLDADQIAEIWSMVASLQRRKVAHRALAPNIVMIDRDGRAGLRRVGGGDLAADDVTLRIDLAQLLTTVSLAVGPERAVASAVGALGEDAVVRAVPVLQTIAMTATTRDALKEHKGLLGKIREEIVALRPAKERIEPVELRRVTIRGVATVVLLGIAAYVILPQLAKVDFAQVISTAQWGWAVAALAFSVVTFAGASVVLNGAVHIHLKFVHTYMTQLAVAFTGLVAPAAVGNIALNTRYLQTSGLTPAVAGASVGLAQVAQFCSYVILLLVSGVLAGTGARASFTPPPILVAAIPVVVLIILGLLAVPKVRTFLTARVVPQIKAAVPQVLAVFQTPAKLGQLLGGALALDMSFVGALVCATHAFGVEKPIAAIAVVYFTGAIIGSAVPTPGGLGGIEAAMSAGLVAIGVDSGTAVSSVLLYRIATYWIPIPFGWFSLQRLQKTGVL